jgi:hypothetical protein
MHHGIVEGEPGIFPAPIASFMRKIGSLFDRRRDREAEPAPPAEPADPTAPEASQGTGQAGESTDEPEGKGKSDA